MSERYDIRVRIGGKLKRMNVGPLLEELDIEGLGAEWGAGFLEGDVRAALGAADREDAPVEFMVHSHDGELKGLKILLDNLNLPYHIETSGNDQYAPTTAVHWPDEPKRRGWYYTSDSQPVIRLGDIRRFDNMKDVEAMIKATEDLATPLPGLQLVD